MNNRNLIKKDVLILRKFFKELCELRGINVLYRAPKEGKNYTNFTEIESNYKEIQPTSVLFEDYPLQDTMRKVGWVPELMEGQSIIHVQYDLTDLQVGCLFYIPSGLDNAEGRLFRVVKMSNIMQFPDRMICALVPEYSTTNVVSQHNYSNTSTNYLNIEED